MKIKIEQLKKKLKKKKLIVFGAGPTLKEFLDYSEIKPSKILDNNQDLWGKKIYDIEVNKPEYVKSQKNVLVVICTVAVEEIAKQLVGFGLRKNVDFFESPFLVINNFENINSNFLISSFGDEGGIYLYNGKEIKKKLSGNFRGLCQYYDGFIGIVENFGIFLIDKDFKLKKKIFIDENSKFHGVTIDDKLKRVFVAETAYDRIGIYDLKKFVKIDEFKMQSSFIDKHHINSIQFFRRKLYASMFSIDGDWRDGNWKNGVVAEIDLKKKKIKKIFNKNLSQPHSILIENNDIYICNSMKFELIKNNKSLVQFSGYVRGLCKYEHFFLIGQSQPRRISNFSNFSNISLDSGFYIWDSNNNTSKFFKIKNVNIFDLIRII